MNLHGIGASFGASHLTMDANSAKDTAGKAAPALVNDESARPLLQGDYTPDTTSPTLSTEGFDFDLGKGEIVLSFTETVKASTFEANAFTLQGVNAVEKVCECQRCLNNEFKVSACTSNCAHGGDPCVDTVCEVCKECPVGEFEVTACTATVNAKCKECKICASDEYLETYCFGSNNEAQCGQCAGDCAACTGSSDMCTECNTGFVLSQGKCVSACPDGTYADDNQVCQLCDPTCKTCTGPDNNECSTCESSLVLHQAAFDDTEQRSPKTCEDKKCVDGKYQFGALEGICAVCDDTCETCYGPGTDNCHSCTVDKVLKNDNSCATSCGEGQFSTNKICVQCSPKCKQCSTATTCTECYGAWVLEDEKCYFMTPTSAKKDQTEAAVSKQISYAVEKKRENVV